MRLKHIWEREMNSDRIKQIQEETAYPESHSVKNGLERVWHETTLEFQQKEADLRAEFQKKIAEINLEHDSMVCENCESWTVEFQALGLCDNGVKQESHFKENFTYCGFGCNKFKKKQQCTQKPNS